MTRLNRSSLDIVFVHDPDDFLDEALHETIPTLEQMKAEGVIKAIGVGMNTTSGLAYLLDRCDLDCILVAGRYTLLDQSAATDLFPTCRDRGVGIVLGGVFNSGVLTGAVGGYANYNYRAAEREILERVEGIEAVCREFAVPLRAAAVAFAVDACSVDSVLVGCRNVSEVEDTLSLFQYSVPSEMWAKLIRLGLIADVSDLYG